MSKTYKRALCLTVAATSMAVVAGSAQAQWFGDNWKRPWWGDEERMDRPTGDAGATAAKRDFDRQYQAYLFGPDCWHETREVRVRGGWAPRTVRVCR